GHRTASADVQAAAVEYHQRLDDMVRLMGAFLHNSEVMVQAATDVVRAYEHADAMSGSDLQAVLDDASLKVGAAAARAAKGRRGAGTRSGSRPRPRTSYSVTRAWYERLPGLAVAAALDHGLGRGRLGGCVPPEHLGAAADAAE